MNINNDQNCSNQGGDERAKDYLNNYFNAQFSLLTVTLIEILSAVAAREGIQKVLITKLYPHESTAISHFDLWTEVINILKEFPI